MTDFVSDELQNLLASLRPTRHPGTFVFATLAPGATIAPHSVIASIAEPEGLSVVVSAEFAQRQGLDGVFRCAWITLAVHSDLAAVGLTAVFASALAAAGVSCNVVAGTRHDHLFVPEDLASEAMGVLQSLQSEAQHKAAGRRTP